VVWTLTLQPESEGPALISCAAWLLQVAMMWPPFSAFVAHEGPIRRRYVNQRLAKGA